MYGSLLIFRVSVRNYALHAPFAKLISLQKCHVEREREPRKGKRAGAFPHFTKKEEEGVTESAKNLKERRSCV